MNSSFNFFNVFDQNKSLKNLSEKKTLEKEALKIS